MQEVLAGVTSFYNRNLPAKDKNNSEEFKDSFASLQTAADSVDAMSSRKQELREQMGADVFDFYYNFLYEERHNPNTDEAKLRAQLNQWIGSNKTLKNLVF